MMNNARHLYSSIKNPCYPVPMLSIHLQHQQSLQKASLYIPPASGTERRRPRSRTGPMLGKGDMRLHQLQGERKGFVNRHRLRFA